MTTLLGPVLFSDVFQTKTRQCFDDVLAHPTSCQQICSDVLGSLVRRFYPNETGLRKCMAPTSIIYIYTHTYIYTYIYTHNMMMNARGDIIHHNSFRTIRSHPDFWRVLKFIEFLSQLRHYPTLKFPWIFMRSHHSPSSSSHCPIKNRMNNPLSETCPIYGSLFS